MPVKLALFNPSPYARRGHVTVDWAQIRDKVPIEPEELVIRDDAGRRLPCQVDPDPATLSFTLAGELRSVGRDDYDPAYPAAHVTLDRLHPGDPEVPATPRPEASGVSDANGQLIGVKLGNGLLDVWILTVPAPYIAAESWFSGAAASVVVATRKGNREVLDSFDHLHHAKEKRALQVDRLWLPCPAWSASSRCEISLFDRSYQQISRSDGPVRATVTLASSPFEYSYSSRGSKREEKLTCRLFRVLSLYAGAEHVMDELFVRGSPDGNQLDDPDNALTFAARYFSYMRIPGGLKVSRFADVPDWFAITSRRLAPEKRLHCYGFATDAHTGPVEHPSFRYPLAEEAANTLHWSLRPTKAARSLHLFTFYDAEEWQFPEVSDIFAAMAAMEELAVAAQRESESRAGKAWYEYVYKRLRATWAENA
jgi:hypothetical protein